MLIIDEEQKFGILWEKVWTSEDNDFIYGVVQIIIDDEVFPKKMSFNDTINVVFHNMKKSFSQPYYFPGNTGEELGSKPATSSQLSYGEVTNIFQIELADIGMCHDGWNNYGSLVLNLGYDGEFERLFYSEDNGETFRELRLKRGTVEKVVMSLPDKLLDS
jgi:hypothetical protein